jgi:murein L,D-transpeptidase YafK
MQTHMSTSAKFSWKKVGITLVLSVIATGLIYKCGRSIWHPVIVRVAGEKSISDRMTEIESTDPDLKTLLVKSVHIVAVKDPGYLQVYINQKPWRKYSLTAQSGGIGPKKQSGDGQIPEGFYHIDSVNPNSSYHLSLRVSYPNQEDRKRSESLGIKDLGGDIYIHGKNASIGCLAIGDQAIEQLFYVVNKVTFSDVHVLISPVDLTEIHMTNTENAELYSRIKSALLELKKGI